MSSNWLKWCKGLSRKNEVLAMADTLHLSRYEVAARLVDDIWAWADENTKIDPESPDVTVSIPNARAAIDALTNVAGFADAMTAVGWLAIRNGSLTFPNFARHNGRTEKDRLLDASRKKRLRNKPDKCPDANRTPSSLLSSGETPKDSRPPAARANALWDAVADQWFGGCVDPPDFTRVGKIVSALKELGATPDEIRKRIGRYRAEWKNAECSPEAIVKHWKRFDGRGGVARRVPAANPGGVVQHQLPHQQMSPEEIISDEERRNMSQQIQELKKARATT